MAVALLFIKHIPWILIAIAFASLLILISYRLVRAKKRGKSACGCGCSGCAMQSYCHAQTPKNKP